MPSTLHEHRDDPYVQLESGLIVPRALAYHKPKPTCVDLFAGAGGFSLGMIEAGFEVVCAVDNDPWATITYLTNLGSWPMTVHCVTPEDKTRLNKTLEKCAKGAKGRLGQNTLEAYPICGEHRPPDRTPVRSFIFGDAAKVTGELISEISQVPIGSFHTIIGGPPCQGYSFAGKRNVHDPRNSMVFEMARLIWELQPDTFVFENVPGIQSMTTPEGFPVIEIFIAIAQHGKSYHDALQHVARKMKTPVHFTRRSLKKNKRTKPQTSQASLFDTPC